jgi:hypothetical protein
MPSFSSRNTRVVIERNEENPKAGGIKVLSEGKTLTEAALWPVRCPEAVGTAGVRASAPAALGASGLAEASRCLERLE